MGVHQVELQEVVYLEFAPGNGGREDQPGFVNKHRLFGGGNSQQRRWTAVGEVSAPELTALGNKPVRLAHLSNHTQATTSTSCCTALEHHAAFAFAALQQRLPSR